MRAWCGSAVMCVLLAFGLEAVGQVVDYSGGILNRSEVLRAAATLTAERYPDADDIWVDEYVVEEYRADGTSVVWDDEYIKVFTEKGKRAHETYSVNFTLPYETVEVRLLEIVKPGGATMRVDVATQSRVMVDSGQMSENIYNPNDKILQVGVAGLEIGDVLHVVSTRKVVKARIPGTWSGYMVFEHTSPIRHITYDVRAPRELPVVKKALRDAVPGTVTNWIESLPDGDRYVWEVRDVPRMYPEPNMPPLHTVVQRLLLSTIGEWQDISKWYWNLCKPRLECVSTGLTAKVTELAGGAATPEEKIGRLFRFVSQEVRYMGITTEKEAPGYEPHDVGVTFDNRYGVCRDKAALLVAMLRLAGLDAYPVLIHVGPKKDEEVPQPYFNHAIVGVAADGGGYTLMDPTDESTVRLLPAYLCNRSYLVAHPDGRGLLVSAFDAATNNLMRISTTGQIDADGLLEAETRLVFDGMNDSAYRGYLARLKPEERQRFFEGVVRKRIPGATVSRLDLAPADLQDTSRGLTADLRYTVRDFQVGAGDCALFEAPWLGGSFGYVNFVLGETGLKERKYPLCTEVACGTVERFDLVVNGLVNQPLAVPAVADFRTNSVRFAQRMELSRTNFAGVSEFLVETVEYSKNEYPGLKSVLKDVEYARRCKPVFESAAAAAPKPGPDVVTSCSLTEVKVLERGDWLMTQRESKKVLTYAGKKRSSELKFRYNPAWSNLRLVYARVTGADGAVRQVSDKEINVMDADWVGAAPRYPAEKWMVVSLPGVEVGSTIEYELATTATAHEFFSHRKTFADFDPVLTNVLVVTAAPDVEMRVLDQAGDAVERVDSEAKGQTRHEWTMIHQPVLKKEESLPPMWSLAPYVFLSSGEWQGYAKTLYKRIGECRRERSDCEAVARKLVKNETNAVGKVRAIRDFVARRIRPAGPLFSELPLDSVTAADKTLSDGYGNGLDRAIVLSCLLDSVGFRSELTVTASRAPLLGALREPLFVNPQADLFDDALVFVDVDGERFPLNDTDHYAWLGTSGSDERLALNSDGRTSVLSLPEDRKDHVEEVCVMRLADNGDAVITMKTLYFGMRFAESHKLYAELTPEERKRHYQELLGDLSQAAEPVSELMTDFSKYPGERFFTAKVPRLAVRSGEYLCVTLPGLLEDIMPLRAVERENALYRPRALKVLTQCLVVLPGGAGEVVLMPREMAWEGPGGLGRVLIKAVEERNKQDGSRQLSVVRSLDLNACVIDASEYQTVQAANRRLQEPESRTILVRMGPGSAAQ